MPHDFFKRIEIEGDCDKIKPEKKRLCSFKYLYKHNNGITQFYVFHKCHSKTYIIIRKVASKTTYYIGGMANKVNETKINKTY